MMKMIKVIKYGKRYATCDKCKSILEFEDSDVRFADGQYKGIVECIDCPVCKCINMLKKSRKSLKTFTEVSE